MFYQNKNIIFCCLKILTKTKLIKTKHLYANKMFGVFQYAH